MHKINNVRLISDKHFCAFPQVCLGTQTAADKEGKNSTSEEQGEHEVDDELHPDMGECKCIRATLPFDQHLIGHVLCCIVYIHTYIM